MPMLANVLLRTQGKNQLLVAATDLNVSLTAELKSTNASEGGITLGAKNLYELIANAPGDEITLKKADNHWAEIKSGKVSYRIVGMPDRDFPKVPDHREASYTTLESAVLREMIGLGQGRRSEVLESGQGSKLVSSEVATAVSNVVADGSRLERIHNADPAADKISDVASRKCMPVNRRGRSDQHVCLRDWSTGTRSRASQIAGRSSDCRRHVVDMRCLIDYLFEP
jgi:DNA polymerase III sliding clamp (beta) subunit (PCNA family)